MRKLRTSGSVGGRAGNRSVYPTEHRPLSGKSDPETKGKRFLQVRYIGPSVSLWATFPKVNCGNIL